MDPEIDPPSFLEDEMEDPYNQAKYSHNLVNNLETKSQVKKETNENTHLNIDHKNKVLITNQNLYINKEKTQKNSLIFCCEFCDFNTYKKQDFNRHVSTQKHKNNVLTTNDNQKNSKKYICDICEKEYNVIKKMNIYLFIIYCLLF